MPELCLGLKKGVQSNSIRELTTDGIHCEIKFHKKKLKIINNEHVIYRQDMDKEE